jgi:hypothetical protein
VQQQGGDRDSARPVPRGHADANSTHTAGRFESFPRGQHQVRPERLYFVARADLGPSSDAVPRARFRHGGDGVRHVRRSVGPPAAGERQAFPAAEAEVGSMNLYADSSEARGLAGRGRSHRWTDQQGRDAARRGQQAGGVCRNPGSDTEGAEQVAALKARTARKGVAPVCAVTRELGCLPRQARSVGGSTPPPRTTPAATTRLLGDGRSWWSQPAGALPIYDKALSPKDVLGESLDNISTTLLPPGRRLTPWN